SSSPFLPTQHISCFLVIHLAFVGIRGALLARSLQLLLRIFPNDLSWLAGVRFDNGRFFWQAVSAEFLSDSSCPVQPNSPRHIHYPQITIGRWAAVPRPCLHREK
ncbi:hypothetical protein SERLA73DRAFT_170280, partial [Serpula lacrymans var. lacrymans S7.3]